MDETALVHGRAGAEYWSQLRHRHYVVLSTSQVTINGTITVRWSNGQVARRFLGEHVHDLLSRPADHAPLGREYTADGEHWHFAPEVAAALVAV